MVGKEEEKREGNSVEYGAVNNKKRFTCEECGKRVNEGFKVPCINLDKGGFLCSKCGNKMRDEEKLFLHYSKGHSEEVTNPYDKKVLSDLRKRWEREDKERQEEGFLSND